MSVEKVEIVASLRNRGFLVKSVRELNKILEQMGILHHYGNGWGTTSKGMQFSIFRSPGLNDRYWQEKIIDAIAEYLKK